MDDEKLIDFHNSCVFAITVCDRFAIANFCATAARAFGRVPGCAMITFSLVSCGFLYASSIVPLPRGHHLQRLFAIGFGDEVLFFCEQP